MVPGGPFSMRFCPTVRLGMQCGTAVDTARTSISLTPIPHGRWFQLAQGTGRSAPADELRSNRLSRRGRKTSANQTIHSSACSTHPTILRVNSGSPGRKSTSGPAASQRASPTHLARCPIAHPGLLANCAFPLRTLALWPVSDNLSVRVTCFYLSSWRVSLVVISELGKPVGTAIASQQAAWISTGRSTAARAAKILL